MNELMLFTDGSVNTKSNVGYGAYLAVSEKNISPEALKAKAKIKRFTQTSSTKLELETLIWALKDIGPLNSKVIVYTDSQNIMGLPERRRRIEKNNYCSKNDRPLNNAELYKEFYKMTEVLNCEFVKVDGHKKGVLKNDIDRLFTIVDRASRVALRKDSN